MVLVHGYGGSGALFFKIIKPICEYFQFILIDIPGMGGSSRPNDYKHDLFTPKESIEYFNDYLERWRKAMDDL